MKLCRELPLRPERRETSSLIQLRPPVPEAPGHESLTDPPVRIFTSSTGIRGEVLCIHAGATIVPTTTHVVILPGNPGIVEYYRPLLHRIRAHLPPPVRERVSLHAVGYPGHDLQHLSGSLLFGMDAHCAFAADYVRALGSGAVLAGHSYGAHVASYIAPAVRPRAVALVTPAVWRLRAVTRPLARAVAGDAAGWASWTAWALSALLPRWLCAALLRLVGYSAAARDVTCRLVDGRRRHVYRNICALAREAMRRVHAPLPCTAGKQGLLVWVQRDRRCPPEARAAILDAFPGCRVREARGCAHAVVLEDKDVQVIAEILAEWVSERVAERVRDEHDDWNGT